MITNNKDNNYVFLYVFVFWIMSILFISIGLNPQKEIFHNYDLKISGPANKTNTDESLLMGHNWMLLAHSPQCTVTLNSN